MSETTIGALAVTMGLFLQIVLQVMARMDAKRKAKSDQAAADALAVKARLMTVKVEEVKTTLAAANEGTAKKLDSMAGVIADTHTLVNNNYGTALKVNMDLARWKASQIISSGDPAAVREAEEAAKESERLYDDHMKKQQVVDQKKAGKLAP